MNGLPNEIKHTDRTLEERGLPADSYFTVELANGTEVSELDTNWSDMSQERRVSYFGGTKVVYVCTKRVTRVTLHHGHLKATVEVPQGYEVYQGVRSATTVIGGRRVNNVLGRVVGLLKGGEVIEERFLNGIEGEVAGRRN